MSDILYVIIGLIMAKGAAEIILEAFNRWNLHKNEGAIPSVFEGIIDAPTYKKSIDYTMDKSHFNEMESLVHTAILSVIIYFGWVPAILDMLTSHLGMGLWGASLAVGICQIIFMLPFLPLQWWEQFNIEARYGFNKSTQGIWWMDRVKGALLLLVLGVPLFAGLMAFYHRFPDTWWIWGASLVILFKLVLMIVYPRLILPLFNKLTALPDGPLRDRLMSLADRAGFRAKTIEVIDGSKRSGHSNAFFTGFGPFRRIVFFDTLLSQLNDEELEAVLAHEIGHYKKGHVVQRMIFSAIFTFGAFWFMNYGLQQSSFFVALGFSKTDMALWFPGMLVMGGWLLGLITFWISPIIHGYSRIHEYQADRFAKEAIGTPEPLIKALQKLHKENLSNLLPHPFYSAFHYSHPTLLEREKALHSS